MQKKIIAESSSYSSPLIVGLCASAARSLCRLQSQLFACTYYAIYIGFLHTIYLPACRCTCELARTIHVYLFFECMHLFCLRSRAKPLTATRRVTHVLCCAASRAGPAGANQYFLVAMHEVLCDGQSLFVMAPVFRISQSVKIAAIRKTSENRDLPKKSNGIERNLLQNTKIQHEINY